MNYLNAVFWDYAKFSDPDYFREFIRKHDDKKTRLWVLRRFLEHARVIDTWKYFTMSEIADNLLELNLSAEAHRKWKRMIEVYGISETHSIGEISSERHRRLLQKLSAYLKP